jgi:hypothetical protein
MPDGICYLSVCSLYSMFAHAIAQHRLYYSIEALLHYHIPHGGFRLLYSVLLPGLFHWTPCVYGIGPVAI